MALLAKARKLAQHGGSGVVLARQCLDRRIPDVPTLEQQVSAWLLRRNKHHAKADWRFTTQDARIKLKNLYPVF